MFSCKSSILFFYHKRLIVAFWEMVANLLIGPLMPISPNTLLELLLNTHS